jgi:acetylornithine deacetylase/succinyl-diaminopimelate desuccinylase-like protein
VLGPGDIAQAHGADEFVELSQLQEITETYIDMINHGARDGAGT